MLEMAVRTETEKSATVCINLKDEEYYLCCLKIVILFWLSLHKLISKNQEKQNQFLEEKYLLIIIVEKCSTVTRLTVICLAITSDLKPLSLGSWSPFRCFS